MGVTIARIEGLKKKRNKKKIGLRRGDLAVSRAILRSLERLPRIRTCTGVGCMDDDRSISLRKGKKQSYVARKRILGIGKIIKIDWIWFLGEEVSVK